MVDFRPMKGPKNELDLRRWNARAVEIASEVDPECGGFFRRCLQQAALLGMEYGASCNQEVGSSESK